MSFRSTMGRSKVPIEPSLTKVSKPSSTTTTRKLWFQAKVASCSPSTFACTMKSKLWLPVYGPAASLVGGPPTPRNSASFPVPWKAASNPFSCTTPSISTIAWTCMEWLNRPGTMGFHSHHWGKSSTVVACDTTSSCKQTCPTSHGRTDGCGRAMGGPGLYTGIIIPGVTLVPVCIPVLVPYVPVPYSMFTCTTLITSQGIHRYFRTYTRTLLAPVFIRQEALTITRRPSVLLVDATASDMLLRPLGSQVDSIH